MTRARVYLIANSHIDLLWLWRWMEGAWTIRHTVRNVINLMREFPHFKFAFSSALAYKWIEEMEPELFERIREMIEKGRWIVVGGWWVEPDCNIPGGESYVRQALYGQRYFKEKLGIRVKVGYNIDSFGHNASLPQILKKAGLDFYIFMRPGSHEKELPSDAFWWEGLDGTRVLAYRLPSSYAASGKGLKEHVKRAINRALSTNKPVMCFYGRGDHGDGPTESDLNEVLMMAKECKDVELVFGAPEEFFKEILSKECELPIVKGELQHHASGCYSVNTEVKGLNRRAEHALLAAERLSVIATLLTGHRYPKEALRRAWELLLLCQFHDSLAGTCIPEAYEDVRNIYGEVLYRAQEAINLAAQRIASRVNTRDGKCVIIFNPTPFHILFPIEVEPAWGQGNVLLDDKGKYIPVQDVQSSSLSGTRRIVFIADLPPLGYRTYILKNGKGVTGEKLNVTEGLLENEHLMLKVDESSGHITDLYDKDLGVHILKGQGAVPLVIRDESDTWSHGVFSFEEIEGVFDNAQITILERGPVRARLRVKSYYGSSELWQDFILYAGLKWVEVRVRVFWHEKHRMLKLAFPVNVQEPNITYEIPYGVLSRPANGEEEPGQRWIDITGRTSLRGKEATYGLTIINDSKYSFSARGSVVYMTVLRSPIYAHHIPRRPVSGVDYRYIDLGEHEFRYIMYPHLGDWRKREILGLAEALNTPLPYVMEDVHGGSLPKIFSLVNDLQGNIVVSVLKEAEDSHDIILRCYEAWGREGYVCLNLDHLDRKLKFHIKPYEIKTFLIPLKPEEEVRECNLLEEAL